MEGYWMKNKKNSKKIRKYLHFLKIRYIYIREGTEKHPYYVINELFPVDGENKY